MKFFGSEMTPHPPFGLFNKKKNIQIWDNSRPLYLHWSATAENALCRNVHMESRKGELAVEV